VLEKEGYTTQKLIFSAQQLRATSPVNPLILKIPWWDNNYKKLVLQPGPERGKDAMISNLDPDTNFGTYPYFEATFTSEDPLTVMRSNRSLIDFSLDELPNTAKIKKVNLRLFFSYPIYWDSTGIYSDSSVTPTSDVWYGAVLQKVISPWDEDSVTWNKQPDAISDNQVYIPPYIISNASYIDLDVTGLFLPSVVGKSVANYGLILKLWPSEQFPGFRFASSDYQVPSMRPMLTVYYTQN